MIRTPGVSLAFKSETPANKVIFGGNVYDLMTKNADKFSGPDVALDILQGKTTVFSDSIKEASSGDHQKITAMHDAEKDWDTTFDTQAKYVERITKGVASDILLSGFKPTAGSTQPAVKPGVVTGIKITSSQQPGGAHIACDALHGAEFLYIVSVNVAAITMNNSQFTLSANPGVISFITDTHHKADFTGLTSGIPLYLTIIAFNTAGMGAIHAPISFKVL